MPLSPSRRLCFGYAGLGNLVHIGAPTKCMKLTPCFSALAELLVTDDQSLCVSLRGTTVWGHLFLNFHIVLFNASAYIHLHCRHCNGVRFKATELN